MFEIIFRITLFVNLIFNIELMENSRNSSKLSENTFAECDRKTNLKKVTKDTQNLCRIECYTKLNNPGFCRREILDPCKTLAPGVDQIKCKTNSGQSSKFPLLCCPFKPEKSQNNGQKPNSVSPNNISEECGKRPTIAAIVGGIDAQPNTWPWAVSIYERVNPKKTRFICGGAIISENYILSAAHCFVRSNGQKVRSNRFVVKVGAHRLSDKNIKFLDVSKIVVHKNYNTVQHYYDIALIKVRNKIEFVPTVGPICLPKATLFTKDSFVGRTTKIVGWGVTRFGGTVSDDLQEVDVKIIDNRDCNRNYSQISGHETAFPHGINEQHICAGLHTGSKDSCQGDSGGPLAMEVEDRWYQLGIVSFGYKCAEPGFPGIYTKIRYFVDWIESQIK